VGVNPAGKMVDDIKFNDVRTDWAKEFGNKCMFFFMRGDCKPLSVPCTRDHDSPPNDSALRAFVLTHNGTWLGKNRLSAKPAEAPAADASKSS
jgi:hypothetical protein